MCVHVCVYVCVCVNKCMSVLCVCVSAWEVWSKIGWAQWVMSRSHCIIWRFAHFLWCSIPVMPLSDWSRFSWMSGSRDSATRLMSPGQQWTQSAHLWSMAQRMAELGLITTAQHSTTLSPQYLGRGCRILSNCINAGLMKDYHQKSSLWLYKTSYFFQTWD